MNRSGIRISLIPIALLPIVALCACAHAITNQGVDRNSYIQQNQRILERLKPYPGSMLVHKSSAAYYQPDNDYRPVIIGYTTNVDYDVPRSAVARRAANYYGRQFVGWKRRDDVVGCERLDNPTKPCPSVLLVHFTRGEAGVSLNFAGFNEQLPKSYELVVDQRGAVQP